jgi:hypothetical protein
VRRQCLPLCAPTNRPVPSPLVGLRSKPGPHIEKINAVGDKKWLHFGAPDAKWGKARGRSWSLDYAGRVKRPRGLRPVDLD